MAATIQIWLSFNNGAERMQLPVNPESIRFSSTHGYDDVDVAQLGEFTVIGNAKLKDVTFSSLFPRDYNSSYCEYEAVPAPWDAVALIEKWKDSGRPMRLTITGTPVNMAVTVRSFNYDAERSGHVGDIFFDISFKEYVFVTFRKIKQPTLATEVVRTETEQGTLRPDTSDKLTSYTVKSGDSLFKIAAKADIYADGDRWRDIYTANTDLIGPNPNLIRPGQTLVIPR